MYQDTTRKKCYQEYTGYLKVAWDLMNYYHRILHMINIVLKWKNYTSICSSVSQFKSCV